VFTLRTTSYDNGRCRTMSFGVAVIEHIDLTAVFTYRTISYDISTTLMQKLNLVQSLHQCRTMSHDVVRHRTTSSGVVESSGVVWHRASRHSALSCDVVRSVNTALVTRREPKEDSVYDVFQNRMIFFKYITTNFVRWQLLNFRNLIFFLIIIRAWVWVFVGRCNSAQIRQSAAKLWFLKNLIFFNIASIRYTDS